MNEEELTAAVKAHAARVGLDLVGVVSVEVLDTPSPIWVGWTYQTYTQKISDHLPEARSVVMLGYHV